MSMTIGGTSGLVFPDASSQTTAATGFGFKNRIINGACMIDQRNAGASVTPASGSYTLDRWRAGLSVSSKFSVQQSTTAPAGFINSILVTSVSAYSVGASESFNITQNIEGLNCADLGWGTANAQPVTLSFWVRSSLTGTFGGVLKNSSVDRAYPFSYTISVANTWEQKTVTITGDTTGTWLTTNGIGIRVWFSLGAGSDVSGTAGAWAGADYRSATGATSVVGTNGATFYITGVQLEKGSTATSFDYRPYGTELALCQRYYYRISGSDSSTSPTGVGLVRSTTNATSASQFPVTMRTAPTALEQSGTAADYAIAYSNTTAACSSVPTFASSGVNIAQTTYTVASGLTVGQAALPRLNSSSAYLAWSAEL